jgi:hypothetical protein
MESIKNVLTKRKEQLLQIKRDKEKTLKSVPKGHLRICKRGANVQYYHRTNPKDFNGVYIPKKNSGIAQKLAQRDYDERVLDSVKKELNALDKYFASSPITLAEDIYHTLHEERRKLICPIWEPEEEFISNWESVEYSGKEFDAFTPKLYTAKGERVRSKSEVIIADSLNREGVPYRYEYPIYVEGWGTVHPDFTVLNVRERKEIYWEHLGMMDDREYMEKVLEKINTYAQNGIFPGKNLILTYETAQMPLNQKMVQIMIEQYLL